MLLEHLPERSAFKTACRDGDWPLLEQLVTGVMNETKAERGDLWAFLGHETLPFKPVLSPSAQQAKAEKQAQMRAAHDHIIGQLRGQN